jgi:HEAT repeat protein
MTEKIQLAMQASEADAAAGARALRSLMSEDPKDFVRASVSMLHGAPETPGREELVKLLAGSDQVVERICDPDLFSDEKSIEIARLLAAADPQLDTKLSRLLSKISATPANLASMERVLRLLEAIPSTQRTVPALVRLLRDPNPRLRAKAALLMGRRVKNTQFAAERMQEADGRVRANAIESLWGEKTSSAIALFWYAVKDTNNRAVGNALVGLYRSQDRNAVSCILAMAADASPQFRMTAAWAMGEAADPRFLPSLEKMGRDLYASVRKNAAKAILRVRQSMTAEDNLQLRVLRTAGARGEDRTVWMQALRPDGAPVRGLVSSNFILWDNQKLVTEYELIEQDTSERLGVGFVLCREGAETALVECLERKPPEHLWTIAKFISGAGESAPEATPAIYVTDQRRLEASIAGSPTPAATYPLKSLLPGLLKIQGSRHLVLFMGSGEAPGPDNEPHIAAAAANNVAIHAVVIGSPHDEVTGACERTGGILLTLPDLTELSSAFRSLYSALTNCYSLRYRPDPAGESGGAGGRIEVYGQDGRGECPLPRELVR